MKLSTNCFPHLPISSKADCLNDTDKTKVLYFNYANTHKALYLLCSVNGNVKLQTIMHIGISNVQKSFKCCICSHNKIPKGLNNLLSFCLGFGSVIFSYIITCFHQRVIIQGLSDIWGFQRICLKLMPG